MRNRAVSRLKTCLRMRIVVNVYIHQGKIGLVSGPKTFLMTTVINVIYPLGETERCVRIQTFIYDNDSGQHTYPLGETEDCGRTKSLCGD